MEATHLGPGWDLKRPSGGHHVSGKGLDKTSFFPVTILILDCKPH